VGRANRFERCRGDGHQPTSPSAGNSAEKYIAPLREEFEQAQSEVQRLTDLLAGLRAKASGLPMRCIRYAQDQLDLSRPIPAFDGVLKIQKNGDARKVVADLRGQLDRLKAERERIATAPLPSADAKAIIRRFVADLAARGAPNCGGVMQGHNPHFAMTSVHSPSLVSFPGADVVGLLGWLCRDQLEAALCAEIDKLAVNEREALSVAERIERERRLSAQILDCERLEEAVIAASADITILRRELADCRAVLGLASSLPAPSG
jgi:hypothetical protein